MNLPKILHSRFASSFTGKIQILVRIIRPKVVARRSTYLWMFRSCRESKIILEISQKMSLVDLQRCQLVIFLFIISPTHNFQSCLTNLSEIKSKVNVHVELIRRKKTGICDKHFNIFGCFQQNFDKTHSYLTWKGNKNIYSTV